MKPIWVRILAVIMVTAAVAGCGTVVQESAMEWMQRQPNYIDP